MEKDICLCAECRNFVEWEMKEEIRQYEIHGKLYNFKVPVAYCKNCNEEIEVPGLMDFRASEFDRQYREAEGIVSIEESL